MCILLGRSTNMTLRTITLVLPLLASNAARAAGTDLIVADAYSVVKWGRSTA